MDEFIWTDDLLTGDEIVDFQHKKLFSYLNILIAASRSKEINSPTVKNTLDALIEYTIIHFEDEEIVLENINYPLTSAHQKKHKEFSTKILELQARFRAGEDIVSELVNLIKTWFVAHIKEEDMKAMKSKVD